MIGYLAIRDIFCIQPRAISNLTTAFLIPLSWPQRIIIIARKVDVTFRIFTIRPLSFPIFKIENPVSEEETLGGQLSTGVINHFSLISSSNLQSCVRLRISCLAKNPFTCFHSCSFTQFNDHVSRFQSKIIYSEPRTGRDSSMF